MTKTNENYVWLAEFYSSLKTSKLNAAVFKKLLQDYCADIDYQIPFDSPVILHQSKWSGYTALHFAVITENKEALDLLLENNADFTIKCDAGFTALHLYLYTFVYNLKGTLTHTLIDSIFTAHSKTNNFSNPSCTNGITHFHIAAIANNADAITYFIKAGVSINDFVNLHSTIAPGYTALHFAVKYCSFDVVKILLQHNINKHPVNAYGITPLHLIIKYKIEVFDAIRKRSKSEDNSLLSDKYLFYQDELLKINKMTELLLKDVEYSKILDYTGFTKFIVKCTDINYVEMDSYVEQIKNINTGISFNSPIWPGWTPLHFAAYFNIDTFKFLLNHGANIAAKDVQGTTPLDICLANHKIRGFNSISNSCKIFNQTLFNDKTKLAAVISYLRPGQLLNTLLKFLRHINIQIPLDSSIWPGYTLLHLALTFAKDTMDDKLIRDNKFLMSNVYLCLKNRADFTIQDANGMTALHLAFRYKQMDVVNYMLNSHFSKIVNPVDCDNLSHFQIVCTSSNDELAMQFLRKGIDFNKPVKAHIKWITKEKHNAVVEAGSTALHFAVAAKNEKIVKLLLDHGADPCIRNVYEFMPVHLGITEVPVNIVNLLLTHSDVKAKNATAAGGLSNLHVACYINNCAIVEMYLSTGVNINSTVSSIYLNSGDNCLSELCKRLSYFSGYTPLHFAVEGNSVQTIRLLIQRGADINAKSAKGLSPLHMALNKSELLDCFVHKIYSDNEMWVDSIGLTSLHLSCVRFEEEKIEKLLVAGLNPKTQIDSDSLIYAGDTPVHILLDSARRRYKNFKSKGDEDFINSFKTKLKSIIKLLFKYGADINIKNVKTLTPVHIAYKDYKHHKDVLEILLESSTNFQVNPTTDEGFSHLHAACIINSPKIVKKFISEAGADINIKTDFFINSCAGCTPLHFAIMHDSKEVIDLLLTYKVDVNAKNCKGSTPLHAMIEYSPLHLEKLNTLSKIVSTANVNEKNIFGKSALELTISSTASNNENAVKLLIRHGARANDFNPITSEGLLAIAFKNKYDSIIQYAPDLSKVDRVSGRDAVHNIVSVRDLKLKDRYKIYVEKITSLVRRKCQLNRQDNTGKTALHLAAEFENHYAVDILLQIGADINITDNKDKVPLAYCSKTCRSAKLFAVHIQKMTTVGLEVHPRNKSLFSEINFNSNHIFSQNVYMNELEEMKNIALTKSLTLRDLLSEQILSESSMMPKEMRQSITLRIESLNWSKFKCSGCLIKFQYRKIMARTSLVKDAKDSLYAMAKFPEPCSEIILRFLSNYELKNLIEASKGYLNPRKRRKID